MINSGTSIVGLSQFIANRTAELDDFLNKNDLPQPSFSVDGPITDYIPVDERATSKLRDELVEAAELLAFLMKGPNSNLLDHAFWRMHDQWTLQVIQRYNIPQHVPMHGTATFATIANASGLEVDKCRRILRYAMTYHLFQEPQPENVAHTPMSALLATDETARNLVTNVEEEVFPATAKQADAIAKWPNTNDPAKNGMALAHAIPDGQSMFDWYGSHPEKAKIFSGAMSFLSEAANISAKVQVAYGYDWAGCGKATLVDVGGSRGHVSIAIAEVAPEMSFIVQDLQETIQQVSEPPSGLEGRLQYQSYDFLRHEQPVTDANIYFFRRVFHDWPDAECITIIKNLVPSMPVGAKVIVSEIVLPIPGDEVSFGEARLARAIDMQMMVLVSSRERGLKDWQGLFEEGSGGRLVFQHVKGSLMSWVKIEEVSAEGGIGDVVRRDVKL